MKKNYLLYLFIFSAQFIFGQLVFEQHNILDNSASLSDPYSVFSADIDSDGHMDVLSGAIGKIVWFKNIDGSGNFIAQDPISTSGDRIYSLLASDIDNDGDNDILSVASENVSWYENIDGKGTFSTRKVISSNISGGKSVYAADLDGDGDLDVLSASSYDNKIAWYENTDGQGMFGQQQVLSEVAYSAQSVYAADLDGDGDMDVLSASSNNDDLVWYENIDGMGAFGSQQIISINANSPYSVYAADLDGDGDMDVLSASSIDDKIAWYENLDGEGDFGAQQIITTLANGAKAVHVADLDQDGDLDVLSSSSNDDEIAWYENLDGEGDFGPQIIISTKADGAWSVFTADLDSDGDIDVLSASVYDNKLAWYKNTDGQGMFGVQNIITHPDGNLHNGFPADIDSDGDVDILFLSYHTDLIIWYENTDGKGTFGSKNIITDELENVYNVHLDDLDGDGDMDVIVGFTDNVSNLLVWFENLDGLGNFGTQQLISNSHYTRKLFTADLDGDNDMDLLSAAGNDKIVWYENTDGMGTFGSQQTISIDVNSPHSVYAADLDGDGDMDVLSTSPQDNKLAWYENTDGDGTFGPQLIITTEAQWAMSIYAADLDGDDDMDVLLTYNNNIVWYENTDGAGTFGQEKNISTNVNHSSISILANDLDGDGDLDVFYGYLGDSDLVWYENTDGQATFSPRLIQNEVEDTYLAYATDINGDGKMDIFTGNININDNKAFWYENLGLFPNKIIGTIRYDISGDDCSSSNIFGENMLISATNSSNTFSTFTKSDGSFELPANQEQFNVLISSELPAYYNSNPISHNFDFTGLTGTNTVLDFCLQPNQTVNDLVISVYPSIDDPKPGFDTTYKMVYKNIGTSQLSGDVVFEFDETKVQFLTASETVSSQTGNTITFNFTDLYPFETRTINLDFNVFPPPTTNIDEILVSKATINPISGDETEGNNVFDLKQVVVGSYDPNDIRVLEGDRILLEDTDKYLHYIIRFQNTGTASAINVRVESTLDNKLDWSTMQIESLSHDGRVEIFNENQVKFIFDNINLPDSTNDEPNSHGYIAYKIKLKDNVVLGDNFSAKADIFFDFNPPIVTNTVNTEIVSTLSVNEFGLDKFTIYPNPTKQNVTIKGKLAIQSIKIYDLQGRIISEAVYDDLNLTRQLHTNMLSRGIYFLEIQSGHRKQIQKLIKK
jgi:hypothetical protein